ncbi:NAD-dependent epimerase/dehydratase family protein [Magnetospirillum moscoviense]|uniref:NAD-dependent dehydratase n=1 Tax=Magnetospirillum moscoviense TaxID=1437059 RepID=A0A178MYV1_9PROT|nr:SDR family NAD(P)-dependent oxidoreductase [Magnetospirillum moscoviense]OAN55034.1 NAD-dependent dehydratase [Magnetospirillum moscoviense]
MAKKILVTGGTGFIGAGIVKRLLADGHTVRVLDNNSRGADRRLKDVHGQYEMVEADIRDLAKVSDAVKGMDCVAHLAYVNGTEFFYTKPDLVLDVGVKGMTNVIDACIAHGVGDFVLASSSEVYQTPPVVPTPETVPLVVPDPLNPRYSYGGGKIICELMALNYGRKHFERMTIFRPHNVYGPDMGWEHVLPQFVLRMKDVHAATPAGRPVTFPIQGSGQETRSFVYIDDFVDGLALMMDKAEHMSIYHIGTMDEVSVADVARQVGAFFGRAVELVPGTLQPGGTMRRCPDIAKLAGLGYAPKVSLAQGVPLLAQWYVDNAGLMPASKD